jgi:diguanylate cyclase (GGDEF)-like protein
MSGLKEEAETYGWDEVERACLFGEVVTEWITGGDGLAPAIEALLKRSESDDDQVMVALALAMRSDGSPSGAGPFFSATPDADLARAAVILEGAEGGTLERISAHTACGIAFGNRRLWDLGAEQYNDALAIGAGAEHGSLDFMLAAVAFNRCEDQVAWAGALRQVGDMDAVGEHLRTWATASAVTTRFVMPERWRRELVALGRVLAAIAGQDVADEAREMLAGTSPGATPDEPIEPRSAGHLKLAVALSDANAGRAGAGAAAEEAISDIDPHAFPHFYDLALYLAAEAEARDGHGAGLRCARRQLTHHWATRQGRLAAMRARMDGERLSAEHRSLAREVNLDDLTGIGNRRALASYLEGLHRGDEKIISLVLADLDDFKDINDRYGHAIGDAALVRVAQLLEHNIRPADVAVRLGGDEFAMVMAGVGVEVARARAESLLAQIDREPWGDLRPGLRLTLSIGVASGVLADVQEVSARADAALYGAKDAGGHSIVCSRGV